MIKQGIAGSALLILLSAGLGIYGFSQVAPNTSVPIHWGLDGTPNGYAPAAVAFFILPLIAIVVTLLLATLPSAMPLRENLERSPAFYLTGWLGAMAIIALCQGLIVASALGVQLNVTRIIGAGIGILFVLIGNVMGKVRRNWIAGIRTPWTLSSDYVWAKTHRWTGRLFVLYGAAIFAAAWFMSSKALLIAIMAGMGVIVLLSFAISFVFWRADPSRT